MGKKIIMLQRIDQIYHVNEQDLKKIYFLELTFIPPIPTYSKLFSSDCSRKKKVWQKKRVKLIKEPLKKSGGG